MKTFISIMVVLGMMQVHAGELTSESYHLQLKHAYDQLQQQERQLQQAMETSQHQLVLIEKACDYANTLKNIRQISNKNRHLPEAKTELVMMNEMNRNINYSFKMFGTSYGQSCRTV